ncbi:MAG: NADH-quinone oxidoreductase subunit NuoE [Planctomycetota bacterium]|nr:NADH-quinone oxidoreductase subunit NuoE [Planctomycetota bacterium]
MLTADEKREIESIRLHHGHPRGAASDVLKIIQRHRGWVPDEELREAAGLLEMSADELDSVASFYNLIYRRRVGRHVILMCDSVCCWIVGYERVRDGLTARLGITLGETTPDGRFTLLPTACLGACDRAPAIMIDDELFGDVDPAKLDEILARYP